MITKEAATEKLTHFREVLEIAERHFGSLTQILDMKKSMLELARPQMTEEEYQTIVAENAEMDAKATYAGKRMNVMRLTQAHIEKIYAEMEDAA